MTTWPAEHTHWARDTLFNDKMNTTISVSSLPGLELEDLHVILIVAIPLVVCMPIFSVILFIIYRRKLLADFKRKTEANKTVNGSAADRRPSFLSRLRHIMPPQSTDRWEMARSRITFGEIIGKGAFGQVCLGNVEGIMLVKETQTSSVRQFKDRLVAVKMLTLNAGENEQEAFLKEIQVMKDIGYHRNIISLIGCCTSSRPVWLIEEYCAMGDLRKYLMGLRKTAIQKSTTGQAYDDVGRQPITSAGPAPVPVEVTTIGIPTLLSFARQISLGMEYLHEKGYVHRDLAARNILLADHTLVKICDFGLTRFLEDDQRYAMHSAGKLPVKWMAIESLFDFSFTPASDVWSFGVVLFELITLGGVPYPTIENRDLLVQLKKGHRMGRPDNCPPEMYTMMSTCWHADPEVRPSFTHLKNSLDAFIQASAGNEEYLQLDASRDYYVHTSLAVTSKSEDETTTDNDPEVSPSSCENTEVTITIDMNESCAVNLNPNGEDNRVSFSIVNDATVSDS